MSEIPPPPPPSQLPPESNDAMLSYGPPAKNSGMAIASMVLGIVAIPLTCLWIGLPIGIVALVLGIIALVGINKDPLRRGGKGFAITGIVTGCCSFLILP